jgi:hypothetical protein
LLAQPRFPVTRTGPNEPQRATIYEAYPAGRPLMAID